MLTWRAEPIQLAELAEHFLDNKLLSAVLGTWINSMEDQKSTRAGARGNDHTARANWGLGTVFHSNKSSQPQCAPSPSVFRCSSACPPPSCSGICLTSWWRKLPQEGNFPQLEGNFFSKREEKAGSTPKWPFCCWSDSASVSAYVAGGRYYLGCFEAL